MSRIKLFLTICAFLGFSLKSFAQVDKNDIFNPVTTSVTSQSIAPDARAGGMGDVGAATDPDVTSQYWNVAKYLSLIHI